MAWEGNVKVPLHLLDSGELPRGTVEPYVALARLAMKLRKIRDGDRFVAARSAVWKALDVGNWPNARRQLARVSARTSKIQWREVGDTQVEITLRGFDHDQGFDRTRANSSAGSRTGASARSPAGSRACPQPSGRPETDKPPELRGGRGKRSDPQGSRIQGSKRVDGLPSAQEGERIPDTMPSSVFEHLLEARQWLPPEVARYVETDAEYRADEWRMLARWHRAHGTRPRSLEALASEWFKNPNTRERAHMRRKAETEAIAQSGLRPLKVRV